MSNVESPLAIRLTDDQVDSTSGAPTTRVHLVNDTSLNPNWGCRGTTAALRSLVSRAGGTIVRTTYLKELSSRTPTDRRWTRRAAARIDRWAPRKPLVRQLATRVTARLPRLPDVVPGTWEAFDRQADAMVAGRILEAQLDAMRASDAVVIHGEGGIYDWQRKGRMMIFLAYVAKTRLGLPTFLVNHTADLSDARVRGMAESVYPLLDDVVFREAASAAECADIGVGREAADAAFLYRPAPHEAWAQVAARDGYFDVWPDRATGFDPSRPYLCLGGSSIYLRSDRRRYDPVPGFTALAMHLREVVGQVVLTASDRPDEIIFRAVAQRTGLPLLSLNTPVQQVVDVLGNARAYVGGRWHPAIYAATGGAPFVSLSSVTFKTRALVEQLGLKGPTFDALDLEGQRGEIVSQVEGYLAAGEDVRRHVREAADRLRARASENVRGLARLSGLEWAVR